jgi:hypothetical protein
MTDYDKIFDKSIMSPKVVFARSLIESLQIWSIVFITVFFGFLVYLIVRRLDMSICNHGIFYIRISFSIRDLRLCFNIVSIMYDVVTFFFALTAGRLACKLLDFTVSFFGVNHIENFGHWITY